MIFPTLSSCKTSLKTVLLQPPFMVHPRNIASGITIPPLWAAYLASTIRGANFEVEVIDALGLGLDQKWHHPSGDFRGLTLEQIVDWLPAEISVLGMSCPFSNAWPMLRDLTWGLKESFPDLFLVLGGEHATAMPERTLLESPADLVVLGEGEKTFLEVLVRLENAESEGKHLFNINWEGVAGVAWKDNCNTVHCENRATRITNLDLYPPPDWTGIPLSAYFQLGSGHGANQGPFLPILATRGCPHQCTFCASPNSWPDGWVARPPVSVVDEMERCVQKFGARDFHFTDLSVAQKREWMQEFCKEILKRNLKISWQIPTGTRSESIDRETASLMARAGCTHISFALESGAPQILRQVKKNLDLQRQMDCAKGLIEEGISLFGFFILGFPGETWGSLVGTFRSIIKAARVGFDEIHISTFFPVPGSAEYQKWLSRGGKVEDQFFTDTFNWATLGKQRSFCKIPTVVLRGLVLVFFASFFITSWVLHPWRPFKEVKNLLVSRTSRSKMVRVLRSYWSIKNLKVVPTALETGVGKPFVKMQI